MEGPAGRSVGIGLHSFVCDGGRPSPNSRTMGAVGDRHPGPPPLARPLHCPRLYRTSPISIARVQLIVNDGDYQCTCTRPKQGMQCNGDGTTLTLDCLGLSRGENGHVRVITILNLLHDNRHLRQPSTAIQWLNVNVSFWRRDT